TSPFRRSTPPAACWAAPERMGEEPSALLRACSVAALAIVVTGTSPAAGAFARPGPPGEHFRSEPKLRPPQISVTADPDARSGDFFIAPRPNRSAVFQRGPIILERRGRLVWLL